MVTKSKNNAKVWSIIALIIAACSIGYCLPHLIEIVSDALKRFERMTLYVIRLIRGSV